jgi:putative FmdB family regulatory protein
MPTYVYECPQCGKFEKTHSIMIKIGRCPNCKRKVIRHVGLGRTIVFKGEGWAK